MVDFSEVRDVLEPQKCGRGHDTATMIETRTRDKGFLSKYEATANYTCTTCEREICYSLYRDDNDNLRVGNRRVIDEGNMDP